MGKPNTARDRATEGPVPQDAAAQPNTTDVALTPFDESELPEFRVEPSTTASLADRGMLLELARAPYLVFLAGSCEGLLVRLEPDQVHVIGRSDGCNLMVDDEGISRRHARIVRQDDHVVVQDLDSRNGTFVGSDRVSNRQLNADDLLRFGARTIVKLSYMDEMEADAHRRLLDAALRDPLTGVYNRRQFHDRLASECAASRRHTRPLTLLLMDVDNFKSINDQHGHPVGDSVLRAIAGSLNAGARREDEVFRYGGEEFAVLARETDLAGGLKLAERRLADIRSLRFPELPIKLRVTMSAGVATFTPESASHDALIEQADEALYAAKRAGKDRALPAA